MDSLRRCRYLIASCLSVGVSTPWTVHGQNRDTDWPRIRIVRGLGLDIVTDKLRLRLAHGLDADIFADKSRKWIVRGYGQTAVVFVDWLRLWTDCGLGCGLDKSTASRQDNGADISCLTRDHFADIRTLKIQGVRRPLLNSHKSCEPSRRILRIRCAACWPDFSAQCRIIKPH